MSPEVTNEFARMLAARQRLLDLRSSRIEQLLRVRGVLRELLGDFFETLDPIANVRLAEISAEGSKAHGDLAITLSFFEGTRMRLAVQRSGRFSHSVSIPSAFDDVARIEEIDVSGDMKRAGLLYEPIGEPGVRRRLDLIATALSLLAHAVAAVEDEAQETAGQSSPAPAALAARLSVAGGNAASTAVETPSLRLTRAPATAPNPEILTFNVG